MEAFLLVALIILFGALYLVNRKPATRTFPIYRQPLLTSPVEERPGRVKQSERDWISQFDN